MELFLDTNVLCGYTFQKSNWNPFSIDVMCSEYLKHSCFKVKKEYENNYHKNVDPMRTELVNAINQLGSRSSSTKDVITILNKYIYNPSVNSLLEVGINTTDLNEARRELTEIINTFILIFSKKRSYLYKNIKFKDQIIYDDKKVYSELEKTGLKGSNSSDFHIVLNAHYIGRTNWKNLCFVTADKNDILDRKDAIVVCTSLKEIIKLQGFREYCKKCG